MSLIREHWNYWNEKVEGIFSLADIEVGIRASNHSHYEWWTGMVPFARLRLKESSQGLDKSR